MVFRVAAWVTRVIGDPANLWVVLEHHQKRGGDVTVVCMEEPSLQACLVATCFTIATRATVLWTGVLTFISAAATRLSGDMSTTAIKGGSQILL